MSQASGAQKDLPNHQSLSGSDNDRLDDIDLDADYRRLLLRPPADIIRVVQRRHTRNTFADKSVGSAGVEQAAVSWS